MKPVKLFVILDIKRDLHSGDVEKLLESNFGPVDHRIILCPNDWMFLSFERLVDLEEFPECSIRLAKVASGGRAGFLQNHRVVLSSEEVLHFKNGKIELPLRPDPEFTGPSALKFFTEVRTNYRQQLRTMCLLRTPR